MKKERNATRNRRLPNESCVMCHGMTQRMSEIVGFYYGQVPNADLALMVYNAYMTDVAMTTTMTKTPPQGREDRVAYASIVSHIAGVHSPTPKSMAEESLRRILNYMNMCLDPAGHLKAQMYLFYCKERDVGLPSVVRYIPTFDLAAFTRADTALLPCVGAWLAENQTQLHALKEAIFSGPGGAYDASVAREYTRLNQLVKKMYTVKPLTLSAILLPTTTATTHYAHRLPTPGYFV